MKVKPTILSAVTALSLWGCGHSGANARADDTQTNASAQGGSGQSARGEEAEDPNTPLEDSNVVEKERRGREGAPTVYDNEATGGSGSNATVTTGDGQRWDVQEEPGFENEPSGSPDKQKNDGNPEGDGSR